MSSVSWKEQACYIFKVTMFYDFADFREMLKLWVCSLQARKTTFMQRNWYVGEEEGTNKSTVYLLSKVSNPNRHVSLSSWKGQSRGWLSVFDGQMGCSVTCQCVQCSWTRQRRHAWGFEHCCKSLVTENCLFGLIVVGLKQHGLYSNDE